MYFTVHNTSAETMPFTLTVDAAALGIANPERLTVAELVSGDAVLYEVQDDLLLIWGELAPLDTMVFQLEKEPVPTTVYLPLMLKAYAGEEAGLKGTDPTDGSDDSDPRSQGQGYDIGADEFVP